MAKFLKEVLTPDEHLLRHKHNKLRNIQGGIAAGILSEYYHLKSCQHTFLTTEIFTDVHKHPHWWTEDSINDLMPRIVEAFYQDDKGDLAPNAYDIYDPHYEKDSNGDTMPRDSYLPLTC
jgi:hypothetical protein